MIYLNNAATSYPKPECVREALDECVRSLPASQYRREASFAGEDAFARCRKNLGKLLHVADTDRIFFTSGATEALNVVLAGFPYPEDRRRILTTETEHNSVLRPLMNMEVFRDRVSFADCGPSGEVTAEMLEKACTDDTGVLIINQCSNVTGMVQDMEGISKLSKEKGLFLIVDASQSAGCLTVDADGWNAAAVIFTGHKSLCGIQGTGGFYIRKDIVLAPQKFGGTGRNSAQLTYPDEDYEYEVGTQNAPGIAALAAGTEYILQEGPERIAEHERKMMVRLWEGLRKIDGVILYGSSEKNRGPLLSFNIGALKPSDTAYILFHTYGIIVRAGLHCAPLIHERIGSGIYGTVRASVSGMTAEEDIDALISAAQEIAEGLKNAENH